MLVDVEGLAAAGRRLSAGARSVDRCADRLARTASATAWRGPAAEAFRAALAAEVARLRAAADRLDTAAAALHRHADAVEHRLTALAGLADDAVDGLVDLTGRLR